MIKTQLLLEDKSKERYESFIIAMIKSISKEFKIPVKLLTKNYGKI
jgi:hypothetical protein